MTAEKTRLAEAKDPSTPWRKWGPYLSERQWGTVREDYSENGNAWDYFSHDQSRSRAYRRGEDGLAGISDEKERLCFAIALWNGKDPILNERLFGLTNSEGNHGEDVKELYYQTGTKAAAFFKLTIPRGGSQHLRLRLARVGQASSLSRNSESSGNGKHGRQAGSLSHLNDFDAIFEQRRREADEFYAELQKDITDPDARNVQRQAFAGMIWSKQFLRTGRS